MWSIEWMKHLFGTAKNREVNMSEDGQLWDSKNRQFYELKAMLEDALELKGLLRKAHDGQGEQSRRQFLELRASLKEVQEDQGQIIRRMERLMSKISDFATAQNAFNDRQDVAVTGIAGDVSEMKALIEKLQNTPGEITPEDQKLLDDLQVRAEAATVKLEALDALTPPPVPTAP